ncbi:hypothetical protein BK120_23015 [Paenibacillus sp. FSL A5-0031]|uniref:hypothetical protein n=1 Tax=Paenibacillus sp. FSL A5-0031 TaxID=1920420 RepID=UPI00096FD607|nr:hypothetical protein [Paenibacillus sp. FSL A5-0031]OME78612.1 hypothetical protein BK120_23015 [Paenibacillus sp. FSL A5-0031]
MEKVEQIDLFEALEKIEEQLAAAMKPVPTRVVKVASPPVFPDLNNPPLPNKTLLQKCIDTLLWPWHLLTSLFGLGIWVNVYTVTRGFGGRENGGWCYLKYECEHSVQVGVWEVAAIQKYWETQYKISHKWGDLCSRRGGQEVVVLIEKRRAASQTAGKPLFGPTVAHTFPYSLVK